MADYTRDDVIADIAKLIAGLQVPVSLGINLGWAREHWDRLFEHMHSIGWVEAEQIEKELRAILDAPTPKPERNIRLWLKTSGEHERRVQLRVDGSVAEWRQAPGAYSSIDSARRAKRKWLEHYEREGRGVTVYIQAPGDPLPGQDVS